MECLYNRNKPQHQRMFPSEIVWSLVTQQWLLVYWTIALDLNPENTKFINVLFALYVYVVYN